MGVLKLKTVDQNLTFLDQCSIYSGDINTDRVSFNFSEHWNGYTKTAIFYKYEDQVYSNLLDPDNSCIIPHEVLKEEGVITIGVYGVKDDKVLTSEVIRYRLKRGAVSEKIIIEPPSLNVYQQVISQYGEIVIEVDRFLVQQTELIETYQENWDNTVEEYRSTWDQNVAKYQRDITSQFNTFKNEIQTDIDEYQETWSREVEDSIKEATNITTACKALVNEHEFQKTDIDGGTPFITDDLYKNDINGGYPI